MIDKILLAHAAATVDKREGLRLLVRNELSMEGRRGISQLSSVSHTQGSRPVPRAKALQRGTHLHLKLGGLALPKH